MTRSAVRATAAALLLLAATPGARAQGGEKLEDLRDWAKARVAAQEGLLKEALDKVAKLFRSTPYGSDSAAVREAVQSLGERASVFSDRILERIVASDSNDVRRHFADVLVAAGDPSLALACLERAQAAPAVSEEIAALLVRTAGRMKAPAAGPAYKSLAAAGAPGPRAEALVAYARLGAADAGALARASADAEPAAVRRATCEALGLVGQGRDDLETLRKLATTDADDDVRRAALRALGRFKGDLDALKTLHEAAVGGDLPTVLAALDGVEAAGTRDLSPKVLLEIVKKGPKEAKERAARVMMTVGSPEGVRTLFARERKDADQNPEDRDLQTTVADRYREFGWYEGAIPFYERALSTRGAQANAQQILVGLARCHVRLKRYDDARKRLKQAGYVSFRGFADDPDFSEMKEQPGFKDLFK